MKLRKQVIYDGMKKNTFNKRSTKIILRKLKIFLKEIKEELNKWENFPIFMVRKFNILNLSIDSRQFLSEFWMISLYKPASLFLNLYEIAKNPE